MLPRFLSFYLVYCAVKLLNQYRVNKIILLQRFNSVQGWAHVFLAQRIKNQAQCVFSPTSKTYCWIPYVFVAYHFRVVMYYNFCLPLEVSFGVPSTSGTFDLSRFFRSLIGMKNRTIFCTDSVWYCLIQNLTEVQRNRFECPS